MNHHFKSYLLELSQASDCSEIGVIQSLWSGYGQISRYTLIGAEKKTVVVKNISLNSAPDHPRGWNGSRSHQRKVSSYEVETNWYQNWNHLCTPKCRVPQFIGSFSKGKDKWIVLEDLDLHFPIRKQQITFDEVKHCLGWLANFHAAFLSQKPIKLWPIGTYWHLETRPDEWNKIQHQDLKNKAHLIDDLLNQCTYQTLVHGDAKLANFCFPKEGSQVAAVDFQYVGGGCGMKDVAYFLGSCMSSSESEQHENELLNHYFMELRATLKFNNADQEYLQLEKEWREMYPVACTDFMRFLLGWMPAHQKINPYNLRMMEEVLSKL